MGARLGYGEEFDERQLAGSHASSCSTPVLPMGLCESGHGEQGDADSSECVDRTVLIEDSCVGGEGGACSCSSCSAGVASDVSTSVPETLSLVSLNMSAMPSFDIVRASRMIVVPELLAKLCPELCPEQRSSAAAVVKTIHISYGRDASNTIVSRDPKVSLRHFTV